MKRFETSAGKESRQRGYDMLDRLKGNVDKDYKAFEQHHLDHWIEQGYIEADTEPSGKVKEDEPLKLVKIDSFINMGMRDYFAAQALIGQCAYEGMEGMDAKLVAGCAYELADAMLAERNKIKE